MLFWPFGSNYNEILQQADALLASPDNGDWREARSLYRTIMDNSRDEELRLAAEQNYFESRRKSMMHRLRKGISPLEKPLVRELYAIMQLESDFQMKSALKQYQLLIDKVDPEDDFRYVRIEAESRLESIREIEAEAEQMRQRYTELSSRAEAAELEAKDRAELERVRNQIVLTRATAEFLDDLIPQVESEMEADGQEPGWDHPTVDAAAAEESENKKAGAEDQDSGTNDDPDHNADDDAESDG